MSGEKKKYWYVVYTKPRSEKMVYNRLAARGIEAYCPLNRVRRKWSDRMKWVEEPLFKSYVFVRVPEEDRSDIRFVSGVVNFIYWLGKPALVRDDEIGTIRKFLENYEEVWVERVDVEKEMKVTIRKGALMGREGKVVKVLNNKVRVLIESIGYCLTAVVDRSNVSVRPLPE